MFFQPTFTLSGIRTYLQTNNENKIQSYFLFWGKIFAELCEWVWRPSVWLGGLVGLVGWKESKESILKRENINIPHIQTDDEYINVILNRYCEKAERTVDKINLNVDEIFYNMEKYNDAVLVRDNELELKWKRRLLFENTPRGNIIMFYDCYKRGFSYYSDQTGIPYNILNAVAMKYVMNYLCYDLFIDNKINKTPHLSPLIKIIEDEDKKERDVQREKFLKNNNMNDEKMKNAPFLKCKKYNKANSITGGSNTTSTGNRVSFQEDTVEPTASTVASSTPPPTASNQSIFSFLGNAVFSRKQNLRKHASPNHIKNDPSTVDGSSQTKNTLYSVNSFVYLGKTHNYYILQKIEPVSAVYQQKIKQTANEKITYKEYLQSIHNVLFSPFHN